MKVYQITKRNNTPNVFGISLVATPAMESDYVMLSKPKTVEAKIKLSKAHDVSFKEINKDKRLLLGLVLEPDKLIYRYNEQTKEEYYITCSKETILELQQDYIKQSNQNYSTLEHDGRELDGVTFTEHWIVEDSNIDKSALHGLSFKVGSWVTVAKIENDTLWNDYIKTGEVMGFSIDAMVHLEEVKLNKDKQMSEQKSIIAGFVKDFTDAIKTEFGINKKEDVKEVEKEVELSEVAEVEVKEVEEVVEVEAKTEIETSNEEILKNIMNELGVELGIELTKVIKDVVEPINTSNVELKKEVEKLSNEVVELGKEPASQPIKGSPKQVDFSQMTNVEKLRYNRENK